MESAHTDVQIRSDREAIDVNAEGERRNRESSSDFTLPMTFMDWMVRTGSGGGILDKEVLKKGGSNVEEARGGEFNGDVGKGEEGWEDEESGEEVTERTE